MSAKDNFAQAMKELLNGTGDEPLKKEEDVKPAPSSFSSFSSQPKKTEELKSEPAASQGSPTFSRGNSLSQETSFSQGTSSFTSPPPKPAPAPAPAPGTSQPWVKEEKEAESPEEIEISADIEKTEAEAEEVKPVFSRATQNSAIEEEKVEEKITFGQAAEPQPQTRPRPEAETAAVVEEEPAAVREESPDDASVTVIAKGTTIVGDISVSGSLRVGGNIKGNVKVGALFELNGNIIGDIEAEDAMINASVVKGDVTVANVFNMDNSSVIVGDVSARSADIDGKIKGNLTLDERGHFQSNSIIMGNLVSGTVIIDEGAMLKGDISITNAQTEDVTVEEPEIEIEI